jgi:hypothetical protein
VTSEEIIRYLMSFLGGGVVVAVGNWIHATRSAQRSGELDRLRQQLEVVYGPCFFFTCQNQRMFDLNKSIQDAYSAHFVETKWSLDEKTQESVRQEAKETLDLANEYVLRVNKNNERVMEILERGWHLIDSDDVPIFSQFQVDFTRMKTEIRGKMRMRMPLEIYKQVGDISFMRPEIVERVKQKVESKQSRIASLLRPWWNCAR